MSSVQVRTDVKAYFAANSAEKLIDISGEFRDFLDLLSAESVGRTDNWVAIQFTGSTEDPISVQAKCYREYGTILMHIVAPITIGAIDGILNRCETIRSIYRGKRIGNILIESVSPPNTEVGTTLEFDNTFMSATFFIDYYADINI